MSTTATSIEALANQEYKWGFVSAPKTKIDRLQSLDEVDPELLRTYAKLGIPLGEQELLAGVAVPPKVEVKVRGVPGVSGVKLELGIEDVIPVARISHR